MVNIRRLLAVMIHFFKESSFGPEPLAPADHITITCQIEYITLTLNHPLPIM